MSILSFELSLRPSSALLSMLSGWSVDVVSVEVADVEGVAGESLLLVDDGMKCTGGRVMSAEPSWSECCCTSDVDELVAIDDEHEEDEVELEDEAEAEDAGCLSVFVSFT